MQELSLYGTHSINRIGGKRHPWCHHLTPLPVFTLSCASVVHS